MAGQDEGDVVGTCSEGCDHSVEDVPKSEPVSSEWSRDAYPQRGDRSREFGRALETHYVVLQMVRKIRAFGEKIIENSSREHSELSQTRSLFTQTAGKLNSMHSECLRLQEEERHVRESMAALDAELVELRSSVGSAGEDRKQLLARAGELQCSATGLRADLARTTRERNELRTRLENRLRELSDLEAAQRDAEGELAASVATLAEVNASLAAERQEEERLRGELGVASEDLGRARSEEAQLRSEVAKLQAELQKTVGERNKLTAQMAKLTAAQEQVEAERATLDRRLQQLGAELASASASKRSGEAPRDGTGAAALVEAQEELHRAKAELEKLRAQEGGGVPAVPSLDGEPRRQRRASGGGELQRMTKERDEAREEAGRCRDERDNVRKALQAAREWWAAHPDSAAVAEAAAPAWLQD